MKLLRLLSRGLVLFVLPLLIFAATPGPTPVGFVNDFANMLSPQFRQSLEQDLAGFEKQTGTEISVVTIDSLNGEPIEDYAVNLFKQWGVGKKGKDNGLLLLISKNDRQVRIEVGYGLEPLITDGRAGRIIRDQIKPAFQSGDYDTGIRQAIDTIKQYILAGQPETPQETVRTNIGNVLPGLLDNQFSLLFIILFILYAFNYMSRTKSIWAGGVFGGVLGAFLGWLFISVILGGFLALALGGFGLLLDYVLSRNYQTRKAAGFPIGFWSSGGGFRGGGSGFGGGGFGGFGGGSSGGGGASGRW